ncbi:MAG: hypothetical protein MR485_06060 [Mollicutes bacterium]|nr:hypothetical protein [Mollicutes bacterium]
MKLVKTQICLYIYEQFMDKKVINIMEIKNKFGLEDKTFMRYINEIRSYLYNFYKGKEIVYVRSEQAYKLVSYEA